MCETWVARQLKQVVRCATAFSRRVYAFRDTVFGFFRVIFFGALDGPQLLVIEGWGCRSRLEFCSQVTRHQDWLTKTHNNSTTTSHNNNSQQRTQQLTTTTHNNKSQQQVTTTSHNNKSQQQVTTTTHNNNSQQQLTTAHTTAHTTTHNNNSQQHTTTHNTQLTTHNSTTSHRTTAHTTTHNNSQQQLSRPTSSRHHISMEHRLRRKHLLLNPDTNAGKVK